MDLAFEISVEIHIYSPSASFSSFPPPLRLNRILVSAPLLRFPINFVHSRISFVHFCIFICIIQNFFVSLHSYSAHAYGNPDVNNYLFAVGERRHASLLCRSMAFVAPALLHAMRVGSGHKRRLFALCFGISESSKFKLTTKTMRHKMPIGM